MASQPPSDARLVKGFATGGATIDEPLTRGERISSFRGHRNDGVNVTIHCLAEDAKAREVQNFLDGARQLASASRVRPLDGVVEVVTVVPNERLYIALGGVAGTMSDIPILGWGVEDTLTFFRHLCRAVQRVHKAGLIHGCMQPGNVLLDDDLKPRLADVGCLIIDDSYDGPSDMKHDYAAYAAREVRLGERAGPRSDIFSLGRLLKFAILGETPSHDDSDIPRLDAMSDLPAGLVRIARKATVREPSKRYASIDAMLLDLERWRDHQAVGLVHPEGREGSPDDSGRYGVVEADDSPIERSGTTERPPAPAPSGSGVAAPASATPDGPASTPPPPVPATYVARGTVEEVELDPLSPLQVRVLGGLGFVLLLGSIAFAYNTGVPTVATAICAVVGTVAASLIIPPMGNPVMSRFISALILGLMTWVIDPIPQVALAGRRAMVEQGAPQARGLRLASLRDRGWRDFSKLDLSGADLSRLRLGGLRFDQASFRATRCAETDLSASTFDGTDVTGADFSGADLSGADTARMRGWLKSRCDEETVMPRGWLCDPDILGPRADNDLAATPNAR